MDDSQSRYRHPGLGFELTIPDGVTVASELPPVLRLGGEGDGGFAPTLAVTAETLDPDLDLDRWVDGSVPERAAWLAGARELDREPVHTTAGPSIRTLAHHAAGPHAVTLEQWWTVVSTRGWVVSAACATSDYDRMADTFRSAAESFRPDGAEGP